MCGFAEELEWFDAVKEEDKSFAEKENILSLMIKAAKATCDFYIDNTPSDGVSVLGYRRTQFIQVR